MQKYYHVLLLGSFPGLCVGSGNEATCTVMHCDDRGALLICGRITEHYQLEECQWSLLEERRVNPAGGESCGIQLLFSALADVVCFV